MANMNIPKKQPVHRPLPARPHPVQAPKQVAQPKAQAPAANGAGQLNNALQNRVVIAPKAAAPRPIIHELDQLENRLRTEVSDKRVVLAQNINEKETLSQKLGEIQQFSIQSDQLIDDFVEQALALLDRAYQN